MHVDSTQGDVFKVWLTDEEIEDLRRATNSTRDDQIIQLGAFVGLRAFEISQVQPVDVSETESGQYPLPVREGHHRRLGKASRCISFSGRRARSPAFPK